jgi:hypothetical protein
LPNRLQVAHRAVRNHAGKFSALCPQHHVLAGQRVGQVAFPLDHDDIARFGHIEGTVKHEIIARSCLHGEGCAQQRRGIQRLNPSFHASQPVYLIADYRDRQSPKSFHQTAFRTVNSFEDTKSDIWHKYFPRLYFAAC